ncbi:hypothetical protein N0V91_004952 [Didymella pomorum]|uniref:Uncharacterized protein n=1 Tax=Didymella pomorum TaxID=749634 RepID=A0A9W8ZFE2_9PLEO|nr:hypothetical protein N0V91_004952 [Didymella pomorum]
MRDRLAQEDYQVKALTIEDKFHRKPNLDTLYYNQTEAIVEIVSANLPPSLLLEKYNEFVEMWKGSNYDLIHFSNTQLTTRELSPKLKARLHDGIVDLMNDRRQGRMSNEDWAKYGSKLAILTTMTMDDIGNTFQEEHDREKQHRETSSTATAKEDAPRAAAQGRVRGGSSDIFEQVPWDSTLIPNLSAPVALAARQPWKLTKAAPESYQEPWVSATTFADCFKNAQFTQDLDDLMSEAEGLSLNEQNADA